MYFSERHQVNVMEINVLNPSLNECIFQILGCGYEAIQLPLLSSEQSTNQMRPPYSNTLYFGLNKTYHLLNPLRTADM